MDWRRLAIRTLSPSTVPSKSRCFLRGLQHHPAPPLTTPTCIADLRQLQPPSSPSPLPGIRQIDLPSTTGRPNPLSSVPNRSSTIRARRPTGGDETTSSSNQRLGFDFRFSRHSPINHRTLQIWLIHSTQRLYQEKDKQTHYNERLGRRVVLDSFNVISGKRRR
ncbi:unnamed protein product [Lactuca virosa]|uniref:Uncharacterized protein n=1 Tax=Lactuca virosa TaxID=75947 RepID=A0AAU9N605_9ASTR|nr:unnamed protein product [Lactuca virosa]